MLGERIGQQSLQRVSEISPIAKTICFSMRGKKTTHVNCAENASTPRLANPPTCNLISSEKLWCHLSQRCPNLLIAAPHHMEQPGVEID
jgi:hypothetical protein